MFQDSQEETLHEWLSGVHSGSFPININIFRLLNILSDEADNAWMAKYCLATATRFGNRSWAVEKNNLGQSFILIVYKIQTIQTKHIGYKQSCSWPMEKNPDKQTQTSLTPFKEVQAPPLLPQARSEDYPGAWIWDISLEHSGNVINVHTYRPN